jgi:hypothetical protein
VSREHFIAVFHPVAAALEDVYAKTVGSGAGTPHEQWYVWAKTVGCIMTETLQTESSSACVVSPTSIQTVVLPPLSSNHLNS